QPLASPAPNIGPLFAEEQRSTFMSREASLQPSQRLNSTVGTMAKSPREIANERQDREEAALHQAIGYFIFWFSQLEFTIKARLAGALQLDEDLFDIIIGPYDFAMLCTVTEQTLMLTASPEVKRAIKKYFDQCRALNQQARIIVAHGSWT